MTIETRRASADDAGAVGGLLAANSPDRGGSLTGEWSPVIVARWIARGGTVILAHDGPVLLGALLADEKAHASAPVVRRMIETYSGADDAYVYGPVCIAEEGRGKGVLDALYRAAKHIFAGREAILFIRIDNARSLRAHEKLGMHIAGEFALDGISYFVLSDAAPSSALDTESPRLT